MRCGKSLEKRCKPGVGRRKIQPGHPRIREVLGRFVTPVTTHPDDKRAGGRVEGRNSAALIGRYPIFIFFQMSLDQGCASPSGVMGGDTG